MAFLLLAGFALAGAVATVAARRPLRAVLGLLVTVVSLAGLYALLHAQLLAALQLLLYAGAIVVLLVFVIMLLGPAAHVASSGRNRLVRGVGLTLMLLVTATLAFALVRVEGNLLPIGFCPAVGDASCVEFGGVAALADKLYRGAVFPFELVSVLLLVAIVGAIAVGRGRTRFRVPAPLRGMRDDRSR